MMALELNKPNIQKIINFENRKKKVNVAEWIFEDGGFCIEKRNNFDEELISVYLQENKWFAAVNYSKLPSELYHIECEIQASDYILELEDNWDDEGALRVDDVVYKNATNFLINYSKWIFQNKGYIIQAPQINPCRDGSIDLSWRIPKARMLINFKNDGSDLAHYYGDYYNNINSIKGYVKTDEIQEFLATWMKILA